MADAAPKKLETIVLTKQKPLTKILKKPVLRIHKKLGNMSRVVWAEESKTGLRFEIRSSYDYVPTRPQLITDGQSSCK